MTKWVRAFTYKPKIEKVLNFDCTQTIREGRKTSVDDEILFHGWTGVPYYSKWSWRLRIKVSKVKPIKLYKDGLTFLEDYDIYVEKHYTWDELAYLARQDGIAGDPLEVGSNLGNILKEYCKQEITDEGVDYEIIFWEFPPLQRTIPKEIELDSFFDYYENTTIVYYHMRRKKLLQRLGGVCSYDGCDCTEYDNLEFHHNDHIERGMERGGGWGHLIQIEKDLDNGHDIQLMCKEHHKVVDREIKDKLKKETEASK